MFHRLCDENVTEQDESHHRVTSRYASHVACLPLGEDVPQGVQPCPLGPHQALLLPLLVNHHKVEHGVGQAALLLVVHNDLLVGKTHILIRTTVPVSSQIVRYELVIKHPLLTGWVVSSGGGVTGSMEAATEVAAQQRFRTVVVVLVVPPPVSDLLPSRASSPD